MPIKDSPKKAIRQDKKKKARNQSRKRQIKELNKRIEAFLEKGEKENAQELLSSYEKAVDKAAKNNTIHSNKADRLKSQMKKKLS